MKKNYIFFLLVFSMVLFAVFNEESYAVSVEEFELMEKKALDYEANIYAHHLKDTGFQVVTRNLDGSMCDEGDSATYTAYYTAAEAFRYKATKSEDAYTNMEKGLRALHKMQEATGLPGIVSRFVDAGGRPYEHSATFTSKDVYAAVPFAYSTAFPLLRDGQLKETVKQDMLHIGNHFVDHNYAFAGEIHLPGKNKNEPFYVNLGPNFTLPYLLTILENKKKKKEMMESIFSAIRSIKKLRHSYNEDYVATAANLFIVSTFLRYDPESSHYDPAAPPLPGSITRQEVVDAGWLLWDIKELAAGLGWEDSIDTSGFSPERVKMDRFFDNLFSTPPPWCVTDDIYGEAGRMQDVLTVDVNGDGRDDLVHLRTDNQKIVAKVHLGDDLRVFHPQSWYSSNDMDGEDGRIIKVFFNDIDGDGRDDMIHARTDGERVLFKVHLSNGTGSFVPRAWYRTGEGECETGRFKKILTADVNGDRRADIVHVRTDGEKIIVKVHFSNPYDADGFDSPPWYRTGVMDGEDGRMIDVLFGDVNGDGREDMVHVRTDNQRVLAKAYISDGSGGFEPKPWHRTGDMDGEGGSIKKVFLTDLNNDESADLIHLRTDAGRVIAKIHAADGNGGFTAGPWYYTGDNEREIVGKSADVVMTDINGDGMEELIHIRTDNPYKMIVKPHFSNGTGSFNAGAWSHVGNIADDSGALAKIVFANVNRDGRSDLVQARIYGDKLNLRFHLAGIGNFDSSPWFPETTRIERVKEVIREHWNEGLTYYLNRLIKTVKDFPNGMIGVIKWLALNVGSKEAFYQWLDNRVEDPVILDLVKDILENESRYRDVLGRVADCLPDRIDNPGELKVVSTESLLRLHLLKTAHHVTGEAKFNDFYNAVKGEMLEVAEKWGDTADYVVTRLLGDEAADASRVQGTHMLKWVALYNLLALEKDEAVRSRYYRVMDAAFSHVHDELNSFVNFIHHVYSGGTKIYHTGTRQGIESLLRFPGYGYHNFEYNCDGEIVRNEFGGCIGGGIAVRLPIPLDKRPTDQCTWQRSPRRLTNDYAGRIFAGVDYLLAYWMGRAYNIIEKLPAGGTSFSRMPTYETGDMDGEGGGRITDIMAADINGDGLKDLVHVRTDSGGLLQVKAHISNGEGGFSYTPWYRTRNLDGEDGMLKKVSFTDVNRDGKEDMIHVRTDSEKIIAGIHLSDGSGGFIAQPWYRTGDMFGEGGRMKDVLFADVNADGTSDMIHVRTDFEKVILNVHLSDGSGGFSPGTWFHLGESDGQENSRLRKVIFADLNKDGRDDLVHVRTESGRVYFKPYLARGAGTFSYNAWISPDDLQLEEGRFANLLSADIDGDGMADILRLQTEGEKIIAKIYSWNLNAPSGSDSPSWYRTGDMDGERGERITEIVFADVNGDKRDDMVHVRTDSHLLLAKVYLSGGAGGFNPQPWYKTGELDGETGRLKNVLFVDLNSDGRSDLVHIRTYGEKIIFIPYLSRL